MKEDDKKPFLQRIPDKVKIAFLRFWLIGLIYYLIGWGTELGMHDNPFDLIFVLALVIGACMIILFNPIINKMFDIERNGYFINKKIEERKIYQGVILNLLEFFKCLLITILIYLTYQLINTCLMNVFNTKNVPLQGEPIIFGLLFTLYYELISFIRDKILLLFTKIKK